MKIKITEDTKIVEDGKAVEVKAGDVVEINDTHARHLIRNNKAKAVEETGD